MRETAPCKGCTDRYTACHGSCEKYQEWLNQFHAQQKYLADIGNRWAIPMTSSRQKAYDKYYHSKSTKHRKGGSDE